ncbi:dephospho-CoA kinase [Candidatus Odyssella thessalonicensis]|uniref:dephospho-CoA kinase n=1 Tax=Candidatus Odyssella thessalonicensis TaxID=84647 RepID=UPI000225C201|nr:dephospho-CoA kinase [Candidatus Odyssella thessalonicensis]
MIILGITGSMASGKSSLTHRIRRLLKWPVWDADAEVQKLYQDPKTMEIIAFLFPQARTVTGLDRRVLRQAVIEDPTGLVKLESVLYPRLAESRQKFFKKIRHMGKPVGVLDIPLLFEKNLQHLCDITITVACPDWLQRQRILKRPGMTQPLMDHLLSKQWRQKDKQQRADIVIQSGLNHYQTWTQFMEIVVRKFQ